MIGDNDGTAASPGEQEELLAEVRMEEVFDYFGKCPVCGYPARAWRVCSSYAWRAPVISFIGSCDLPCGWRGPVRITTMTDVGEQHRHWSTAHKVDPAAKHQPAVPVSATARASIGSADRGPHLPK